MLVCCLVVKGQPEVQNKLERSPAEIVSASALVNKNWTRIFKFFTENICFLYISLILLIHPCLAGWSVSGMERL